MKARELNYNPSTLRFRGIVGTGGIGSGSFFILNGNKTLGREESRSGHLLQIDDYCKQHIILHYIKVLLGSHFRVIPVGKAGDDDIGRRLLQEMNDTGFETSLVSIEGNTSTLFSFCYYYPDGSGGNLTTDNSASSMVDIPFIEKAVTVMKNLGNYGIAMAAPEVPLLSRVHFLRKAKEHGMFTAASFTSGEAEEVIKTDMIENSDLLAINADEAGAFTGIQYSLNSRERIIESAIKTVSLKNRNIQVTITSGGDGSWTWDGSVLCHCPATALKVISTAGAGDAFFSGILTGLALGLSLADSQKLATLVASHSVSSPDTINKETGRDSLRLFAAECGILLTENLNKLLED